MSTSFIERKIDVQMALDGDTFDGSNNTIQLSGLRCQAVITLLGGKAGPAVANLQMRINGMKNADMAKLSTLGYSIGQFKRNAINVYAGDDQSGMSLVFQGAITYGNVDYNAMPDVGLEITSSGLATDQYTAIAANSFKGDVSAASVIESIASAAGKKLINNGVTVVLSNPAEGGTAVDQISAIARAGNFYWKLKGDTYYIWPDGGSMDDTVIDVGPDTGMVGYPRYHATYLQVTSLFNPQIEPGRMVRVTSSTPQPAKNLQPLVIPGINETLYCGVVTHNLSSQQPGGPWFTEMDLYTANAAR